MEFSSPENRFGPQTRFRGKLSIPDSESRSKERVPCLVGSGRYLACGQAYESDNLAEDSSRTYPGTLLCPVRTYRCNGIHYRVFAIVPASTSIQQCPGSKYQRRQHHGIQRSCPRFAARSRQPGKRSLSRLVGLPTDFRSGRRDLLRPRTEGAISPTRWKCRGQQYRLVRPPQTIADGFPRAFYYVELTEYPSA